MLKKVGMILVGILLIILMVEVALRAYFQFFGTETDRIMYVYSAEQIMAQNMSIRGLPLVGYGPSPSHPDHNALGFRNREISIQKPDDIYRIVAIGGSTTYGTNVSTDETWPSQLEAILHDHDGLDFIEVINTASVGYSTWNSLTNLVFRVLDLEPDLIIIYHNTNDARARDIDPTCFTGNSPIRGLARGIWRSNGPSLSPSTIVRYVGQAYGWQPNPIDLNIWILPVTWSDPSCRPVDNMTIPELLEANPPVFFERNLRNMVYLAQAHDVEVMLSTWAYHPDMAQAEFVPAFDEQNQIIRELADELNVHIVDLMSMLPVDETLWFFDGEHQNARGYLMQAEHYAMYIAETIQPSIVGN